MWTSFALETRYELTKLVRLPVFAMMSLGFPLLFYLMFGVAMAGSRMMDGRNFALPMLATYGAFGVIGAALFSFGVGVAVERAQGWLLLKRATPMPPLVYVMGKVAASMTFCAVIIPINVGGATYVIFSAAVAGFVFERRRDTVVYVLCTGAVLLLVMLLTRRPFEPWMLFQPTLVVMVGLGNIVAAEDRRRNQQLRRANENVEEMAKLAERERIARDLHDVLGHTLSVIALKSELASKLSTIDPERAFQEIREVERVSRSALSEVRHAVEGYRGHGLRGEIESAGKALGAAGVQLRTDVEPVQLPAKHETVLALAVREGITNVVRHAHATMCRISLVREDGRVVLRIEDDGIGSASREGNGLTGMRERIAAIGGTLSIGPSATQHARPGFLLTVTV